LSYLGLLILLINWFAKSEQLQRQLHQILTNRVFPMLNTVRQSHTSAASFVTNGDVVASTNNR